MSREGIIKKRGNHERQRVFSGIRGRAPQNKAHKRTEAAERLAVWQAMPPEQQLVALDRRLGKGKGAASQRARIASRIVVAPPNAGTKHQKR